MGAVKGFKFLFIQKLTQKVTYFLSFLQKKKCSTYLKVGNNAGKSQPQSTWICFVTVGVKTDTFYQMLCITHIFVGNNQFYGINLDRGFL